MASANYPVTGGSGSIYWKDAVATSGSLPGTDDTGTVRQTLDTGDLYIWDGASWNLYYDASASVTGPASSTDNAIARFDGTGGATIQNSGIAIDDSDNVTGVGTLGSGEITSSSLTGDRVLVAGASKEVQSSNITSTTLGYLDATSSIQTQLDAKLDDFSGSADNALVKTDGTGGDAVQETGVIVDDSDNISGVGTLSSGEITSSSLTGSRVLTSGASGEVQSSSVTTTTLGYLDATSSVQTQLDSMVEKAGDTMTGLLTLSGDPSTALQAATKQYVDAKIDGVQRKASVVVATTANITLSGEQTIDGVLTSTSRVLVKDQTSQDENGIYESAAGAWARTSDANTASELNHAIVSVQSGTANGNTAWEQVTDDPNVGVDNVVWNQAYGAGTYTADGDGIELSGGTFSLELDGSTLSKSSSGVKVADGGISNDQVNASAGISLTKLDSTTVDRAIVSNGTGKLSPATTTSTEIGYVNGVTSGIQGQLDAKLDDFTGAADNALVKTDGTGGDIIQETGVIVDDSNNVSGVGSMDMSSAITMDHITTPSNPAASHSKLYTKSDGKWYRLDSSGNEVELGSGGSGGGINLVDDPNASSGAVFTDDASDGITVSQTTTTSEIPLSPLQTTAIKFENDGSGTSFTGFRFQVPESLKNHILTVSAEQLAETGYDTGDYQLELHSNDQSDYAGTYTEITFYEADSSGDVDLPAVNGKIKYHFITNEDYLELRVRRTAGSNDLYWSQFSIGPESSGTSAIITEWQAYTPSNTQGFGSITGNNLEYRRNGTSMEIRGYFTSGTVTGDEAQLELPDSKTIGGLGTDTVIAGYGERDTTTTGAFVNTILATKGDTYLNFARNRNSTSNNSTDPEDGNEVIGSTTRFTFQTLSIPIQEWEGSGTANLGSNDVEYVYNTSTHTSASDTTSFAYGPGGAQIQSITATLQRRVRCKTKIQPTDSIRVECSEDGNKWSPVGCKIPTTVEHLRFDGSNEFGIGYKIVNDTDIDIWFGQYRTGTSSDWSTVANSYWRVVKTRAGVVVPFGLATSENAGLVKKNIIQKKKLTSDKDSTDNGSAMTDLSYTLTVGKIYTVRLHGYYRVEEDDSICSIYIKDGSTIIGQLASGASESTNANDAGIFVSTTTVTYEATNTALTFEPFSFDGGSEIRGNDTFEETWVEVEERNDLVFGTVS